MHFVSTTLNFTLLVYNSIQCENGRGLQTFEPNYTYLRLIRKKEKKNLNCNEQDVIEIQVNPDIVAIHFIPVESELYEKSKYYLQQTVSIQEIYSFGISAFSVGIWEDCYHRYDSEMEVVLKCNTKKPCNAIVVKNKFNLQNFHAIILLHIVNENIFLMAQHDLSIEY